MNASDVRKEGLSKGSVVDILSYYDGVERKAEGFTVVPYDIPSTNCATYFPEANAVVPYNHFARKSQTPISKSVIIKIVRKG
jgi:anaerobic selenocysteine-containing dehydrogenase